MRKVTIITTSAFEAGKELTHSNTTVKVKNGLSELYLFGNKIAVKHLKTGEIYITNAGYKTATTKERLNGINGVQIVQRSGVWYLNDFEWSGDWTNLNEWNRSQTTEKNVLI